MDPTPGQTLGDYEILGVLGAGGMGKVYQVRNIISQRIEAMKVLLPDLTAEPELGERFLREIRISASLDHPHIAALRTAQRIGNQLVMIMEYVDGCTLDALMRQGRVPLDRAIEYMSQSLEALDYAHGRGVVHRDIKPGNIMITLQGEVKLMDFGIAKVASDRKLTKTGLMVGSVYYMSPEQIEGRELDSRSDLYSLGVTMYELVTGKRPFNGDSEYQVMAAHLKETPRPPLELDPSLPPALNQIILMALAKEAARRFGSANAMRNALASLRPKPAAQPPGNQPLPVHQMAKPRGNRLLYMVLGSVATLLVLIAAIVEIPKIRQASADTHAAPTFSPPASPVVSAPVRNAPATVEAGAPQRTALSGRVPAPQQTSPEPRPKPAELTRPSAVLIPEQQAPPPQVQPRSPVAESPSTAPNSEMADLRDRMMLLSTRAGAIRTSLQNLQRSQAQSGLGLRSDMVAAEQRLVYQMEEAENSMRGKDAAGMRKRLDAAEREVEKLENFFGR